MVCNPYLGKNHPLNTHTHTHTLTHTHACVLRRTFYEGNCNGILTYGQIKREDDHLWRHADAEGVRDKRTHVMCNVGCEQVSAEAAREEVGYCDASTDRDALNKMTKNMRAAERSNDEGVKVKILHCLA